MPSLLTRSPKETFNGRGGHEVPNDVVVWRNYDLGLTPYNFMNFFRQLWKANGFNSLISVGGTEKPDTLHAVERELVFPSTRKKPEAVVTASFTPDEPHRILAKDSRFSTLLQSRVRGTERYTLNVVGEEQPDSKRELLGVQATRWAYIGETEPVDEFNIPRYTDDEDGTLTIVGERVSYSALVGTPRTKYQRELAARGITDFNEFPAVLSSVVELLRD